MDKGATRTTSIVTSLNSKNVLNKLTSTERLVISYPLGFMVEYRVSIAILRNDLSSVGKLSFKNNSVKRMQGEASFNIESSHDQCVQNRAVCCKHIAELRKSLS